MMNAESVDLFVPPELAASPVPRQVSEDGATRQGWDRLLHHARVEPLIRKMFRDQRRHPRVVIPHVVAYLGNAHKSRPYQIINISSGGFCMLTENHWTPGTEMPITLQREEWDGEESPERLSVQAIVARRGPSEVGFSIVLTPEESIAFSGETVSQPWINISDVEEFIRKLQKPKPPRMFIADCPRPRPMSVSERTQRLLDLAKSYRLSSASELWTENR